MGMWGLRRGSRPGSIRVMGLPATEPAAMRLRSYRMVLALAAFAGVSVAGAGARVPTGRFAAGTARAQSDPASRTLRFASSDIVRATHRVDDTTRTSVVEVRLSRDAAARLRDFTTTHVGRRADLKVDGCVLSSPVI